MGGPISVVFLVWKMEEDIAILANPIFYQPYVCDTLYEKKRIDLNSYYKNIKLTLEVNPKNLPGTEIIRTEPGIKTQVYNKSKKLPVHWPLRVPFKYKRNVVIGELQKPKRRALDFDKEN